MKLASSTNIVKEEIPYNPSQVFLTWLNEGRKYKDTDNKPQRKIKLTYSKQSFQETGTVKPK